MKIVIDSSDEDLTADDLLAFACQMEEFLVHKKGFQIACLGIEKPTHKVVYTKNEEGFLIRIKKIDYEKANQKDASQQGFKGK